MMKIVIDTTVLLMILPKLSKYRLAFDALISGKYTLALSNEILSEYVEKLEEKTTVSIANNVAELLNVLPNVEKTEIYYNWSLITKDDDDFFTFLVTRLNYILQGVSFLQITRFKRQTFL